MMIVTGKGAVEVPLDESTAFIGSWIDYRGVATEHNYKNMALIGQIGENAGVFRTLKAQSVDEVRKGVYVYDMGQNMVGVPRITIKDGVAGKKSPYAMQKSSILIRKNTVIM